MTTKKKCESIIDRIKFFSGSSLDSEPIYLHEPNFDNSNAQSKAESPPPKIVTVLSLKIVLSFTE